MNSITERQKEILNTIIREYMENAIEVGSNLLVDKYDLGVSSATIRNEMIKLMELGMLVKSHISSGRIPTDQAIRMYVNEFLSDTDVSAIEEVDINQNVFRDRFEKDRLISVILELLNKYAKSASFVVTDDMVRYYGVSALMKHEELQKVHTLERIFDLLEDSGFLKNLFSKYMDDEIGLLIGAETGIEDLENCAIVFGKMPFWGDQVLYYGIVGTRRLDYEHTIGVMKVVKIAVEKALRGWV
jgi:transcriptional regulator of heat shock response